MLYLGCAWWILWTDVKIPSEYQIKMFVWACQIINKEAYYPVIVSTISSLFEILPQNVLVWYFYNNCIQIKGHISFNQYFRSFPGCGTLHVACRWGFCIVPHYVVIIYLSNTWNHQRGKNQCWLDFPECIWVLYPIRIVLEPDASIQPMNFSGSGSRTETWQDRSSAAPAVNRSRVELWVLGLWRSRPSLLSQHRRAFLPSFRRGISRAGCQRRRPVSARYARTRRAMPHHRLGLPCPPSPDQHPPAGGGHVLALQRLTVSGLPEK